MSGARAVRLIAMREIAERVRGRALRVMTALTTLLVVAGIVIPAAIRGGTTATTIGLVGAPAQSAGAAIARIAAGAGIAIVLVDVPSVGLANDELQRGTLDVALVGGVDGAARSCGDAFRRRRGRCWARRSTSCTCAPRSRRPGCRRRRSVRRSSPCRSSRPRSRASVRSRRARRRRARGGFLMYISLGLYGAAVAGGVAQEKTSRTAELLLAAVRPTQLLAGKVIGIGLVGLGQLSVAVVAGLIANATVHSATIPSTVWALLPAFLAWYLAGFVLYAFAFAAAGALVARQEEVQFVTMPFGIVLVAGYLLVYAAIANPDATWLRVASLLPPLSASLMPARIALGHVPAWQIALDAALMLAAIRVTAALSARIYVSALVRGGARLSWRAALALRRG